MENKKTRRIGTRLAVFGCALALVTMAGVGMTFAKYTKSTADTQNATVSNFGVTLDVTGDLFSKSYGAEQTYKKDFSGSDIEISVRDAATASSTNMVAPGTSGSKTYTATLDNNQVAVSIVLDLDITLTSWTVDGVAYEPITWTLSKKVGTTEKFYNGTNWESTSAVNLTADQLTATAISTDNFAPNQPAATKTITYTLAWNWEFEQNAYLVTSDIAEDTDYASGDGDAIAAGTIINASTYNLLTDDAKDNCITTDAADTKLGEASSKATVEVEGTLSATQIN